MARGDLHIHTSASDGVLSPADIAEQVIAGGLDFLSVTDHNTLGAIRPVAEGLRARGPQLISGVELSAQPEEGDEIHVLGYGFDPECLDLQEVCREICRGKWEQLRAMIGRLRAAGIEVEFADLAGQGDDSYVGRPILADLLLRNHVVASRNQAFARYLGRGGRAFVPMRPFSSRRCIEAIHRAGGVAVLAHPRMEVVDRWIEHLAAAGLDGIEAYRPALTGNEQLYVEKAAEHFGLFVTGGSDWHGHDNGPPLGAFAVSREQVGEFLASLRPGPPELSPSAGAL